MVNYANGKIYKIYSPSRPELGDYYGSTTQSLALRIGQHRSHEKLGKKIKSAAIIAAGDAVIVLVELCPVGTKEELIAREAFWIRSNPCINKQIPGGMTIAEIATYQATYYAAHRGEKAAKKAAYRAAHKVELSVKQAADYAAHKVEILAKQAAYDTAHKVEKAAYAAANRARINERQRERRAAKKAAAAV